jgi:hypothetical protein
MGNGAASPGIKQLEREANHSPISSTEVNNMWRYTFTSPYVLTASTNKNQELNKNKKFCEELIVYFP